MLRISEQAPRQDSRGPALGTVLKATKVLDYVVNFEDEQGASAATVASALRLDRTTAHRLLKTLARAGLVHQTTDTRYVAGPLLLSYSLTLTRRKSWLALIRPTLEWLVEQTGETATFSVLLPNRTRMFVEQQESPQTVRWVATLGVPMPLYAGASSKAILAAMRDEDVDAYLAETQLERITRATIANPRELRGQLERIRRHGYATSRGERSPGSGAVAAAIVTRSAGVVGAISICGPISRMIPSRFQSYGALAVRAGRSVSQLLEARP